MFTTAKDNTTKTGFEIRKKKKRIKLKLILRQGPWKNIFYGYENAAISPQCRVASS